jgi:hypothetical protein
MCPILLASSNFASTTPARACNQDQHLGDVLKNGQTFRPVLCIRPPRMQRRPGSQHEHRQARWECQRRGKTDGRSTYPHGGFSSSIYNIIARCMASSEGRHHRPRNPPLDHQRARWAKRARTSSSSRATVVPVWPLAAASPAPSSQSITPALRSARPLSPGSLSAVRLDRSPISLPNPMTMARVLLTMWSLVTVAGTLPTRTTSPLTISNGSTRGPGAGKAVPT